MAVAKAACLVCVASAARAADSAVRRVAHAMVVRAQAPGTARQCASGHVGMPTHVLRLNQATHQSAYLREALALVRRRRPTQRQPRQHAKKGEDGVVHRQDRAALHTERRQSLGGKRRDQVKGTRHGQSTQWRACDCLW